MKFYIETERLILRDLLPSDKHGMFELDSDPLVHRFLGGETISSINVAEERIELIRKQYEENGIGRWAMIEKESGEFTGWSGLKLNIQGENQQVNYYDVGYRIIPKFWGKGYATESAKRAVAYGFEMLQLDEIIGTLNAGNHASRKVLEKCGLQFESNYMRGEMLCEWMKITREEFFSKQ